ncbi:galactose-1-phosphate uridylyltransferase [Novipirellula artificiosorum]|uniref:Galactose-1-phosphate uridylyltransferase n=1 Tax=Novipirellula artificiosorum TaxID=2528016 RepID=A0A5C6DJ33_9BACT|nr:DUF4921 family protein [Novipirellula artificiosorum]TWU37403.1 Galactose-1-phosphate uridylyltransferase [Novipirellula artificiosorum]
MIENVKTQVHDRFEQTVPTSEVDEASHMAHNALASDGPPDCSTVPSPKIDRHAVASPGTAQSRLDPITGEWTIFAPHRGARPNQFGSLRRMANKKKVTCPFCAGEEASTPSACWAARVDHEDRFVVFGDPTDVEALDWSVRVVPNKYPVITENACGCNQGASLTRNPSSRSHPLFQSRDLIGGHEVIIESPYHVQSLSELDLAETKLLLFAYQQRLRFWRNQKGVKYISLFKNVGGDAGASLQHSHSQLIATDQIPNSVETICERMRSHQAKTGCCLQCDIIRAELKHRTRIVAQTDSLVAYCPYASRLPMLIRVTTKEHIDHFDDVPFASLDELARLLQRMTGWLESMIPQVAYNVLLHTRPPGATGSSEAFHWSLEFFPRISRVAGFEWSSDCMINTVLPEVATEKYRQFTAAEDPRRVL